MGVEQGRIHEPKSRAGGQEQRKSKVSPTDRPTDRQTDRVGCRVACTRLKSGSLLVGRGVTRPCRRSDISNVVVFFFSLYSYSGVPNCDLPIDAARRTDGKTDLTCLLCGALQCLVQK